MGVFYVVHFQQFEQRKKVWNESIPCGTFSIGGTKKEGIECK